MEDGAPTFGEKRRWFYLSKVREAKTRAATARDTRISEVWLEMAQSWEILAHCVEREFRH